MPEPLVSVIIPTYNRSDILLKTLNAYSRQTVPVSDFEILVVDDGSQINPSKLVLEFDEKSPLTIRYFQREHKGANACRNTGIQNAKARLLLITGDDIIPQPDFLEQHMAFHQKYQMDNRVAVLGYTTWTPEINASPLMKYFEHSPFLPQFEYNKIKDPDYLSHEYFYTSNISLHLEFLLKFGIFDEEMNKPFADDGELAYRLKKHGLRIIYNPDAKALHWHVIRTPQLYKRARNAGEMCYLFYKKHPELGHFPPAEHLNRIKEWLHLPSFLEDKNYIEAAERENTPFENNPTLESAYQNVLMKYYIDGVRRGVRLYGK